ncbi:N-6 DNA methylase [Kitasatospora sp. NPDC007106]|uniref:N-6 DNA methylase n=1 Tax=Kitasatospora sp. NPDC007106 TaxID=3156914 RepID=UPI0034013FE5
MPKPAKPTVISVTLAEIARISGVGRAAVSNWRRRHEDFPTPVGGSDASPQFDLFEVEEWLRKEKKIKPTAGQLERLWPQVEALGDRRAMGSVVAAVGARLSPNASESPFPVPLQLTDDQQGLVERAVELAEQQGASETFDFLLQRWLGTHVRQIITTPEPLAELLVDIAQWGSSGPVRTVLDPACGTGTLLLAAARRWKGSEQLRLLGQDIDPVLCSVTTARLLMAQTGSDAAGSVDIKIADTLRADAHAGRRADVVLCNPPTNEREWGHSELATDPRWVFGQPSRTEPELAWVQHIASSLAPGGTAVLVLPPAVAARRAGRRIRAALLRAGVLRAVIALPPGAAPPHGVGLQLWVLCPPSGQPSESALLLVDAAMPLDLAAPGRVAIDWPELRARIMAAMRGGPGPGHVSVPVIELLDELVDLTPARHVPGADAVAVVNMRQAWTRFDVRLDELRDLGNALSKLAPARNDVLPSHTTVGELELAGALELRQGQALPEDRLQRGDRPSDSLRALTLPDLVTTDGPGHWLAPADAEQSEREGNLTVTASQDIIVVGAFRAFDAWVDTEAPTVLGPQLHMIRTDPSVLDPWFLAGCLRSPANARQAGTHAATSSRVDVRRLQVPRLSLDEQRQYGESFRKLVSFERTLRELNELGAGMGRALGDLLASGRLPRD